jgi:hypothetical protein
VQYAFQEENLDLIRVLLDMGLDMTEKSIAGGDVLSTLLDNGEKHLSPELFNFIFSIGNPDWTQVLRIIWTVRSSQLSQDIMRQGILRLYPEHYRSSVECRLCVWGSLVTYLTFGPRAIRVFLWDNFRPRRDDLDQAVLHWVTWICGMAFVHGKEKSLRKDWVELLSEIFANPKQLYICQRQVSYGLKVEFLAPLTPLLAFLCGVVCEEDWHSLRHSGSPHNGAIKALNKALKAWLTFVQKRWPQISLESHGSRELALISPSLGQTLWLSCWFGVRAEED